MMILTNLFIHTLLRRPRPVREIIVRIQSSVSGRLLDIEDTFGRTALHYVRLVAILKWYKPFTKWEPIYTR